MSAQLPDTTQLVKTQETTQEPTQQAASSTFEASDATPDAVPDATPNGSHQVTPFQIPVMSRAVKPARWLMSPFNSKDPRAEKIRALRSELMLRREGGEQTGVIALISPGPGEGRTQLAAELAIAFAELGRSTLLVDADLRRPQLHLLFNANNGPGLAQALERGIPPHLFAVAGFPQLCLLTAGSTPHNPAELLSHDRFALMMADWRQAFEFVVIDTPPMSCYGDGLAVAGLAGRVLTVSRANYTLHNETQAMLRRLTVARSEVAGAVISRF